MGANVFCIFNWISQSFISSGNDSNHGVSINTKRRRAFWGIEHSQTSTGPSTDKNKDLKLGSLRRKQTEYLPNFSSRSSKTDLCFRSEAFESNTIMKKYDIYYCLALKWRGNIPNIKQSSPKFHSSTNSINQFSSSFWAFPHCRSNE